MKNKNECQCFNCDNKLTLKEDYCSKCTRCGCDKSMEPQCSSSGGNGNECDCFNCDNKIVIGNSNYCSNCTRCGCDKSISPRCDNSDDKFNI